MSPRKRKQRTEKDEAALQAAMRKQAKRGKGKQANKSVGARLRRSFTENA